MSPDRRRRLEKLVRDHAANGAAPFEVRARLRCLRPETLTDMELRQTLMMVYGPVLEDLDSLGLAQFYRLDLARVVGKDRVDRVLGARYARPPVRRRPSRRPGRRWLIGGAASTVVAAVLAGAFVLRNVGFGELAMHGLTSPTLIAIYRSPGTPTVLRDTLRKQTLKHLDQIPVGSDLWWAVKSDVKISVRVRARMDQDLRSLGHGGQDAAMGDPRVQGRSGSLTDARGAALSG